MRYSRFLTVVIVLAFSACSEELVGPGRMEDGERCRGNTVVGWEPENGTYRYCAPPDFG